MVVRDLGMVLLLAAAVLTAQPAVAAPGDAEKGEEIYATRCMGCHGEEGDGFGPAAERLNPPPRDFTLGLYKIKTTGFDDIVPNDDDLFRMIRDGMPGTSMPGWGDVLSDQDMWDLIAYIKIFAGLEEEEPTDQLDYGTQIASSEDSIAKGKPLFEDRCAECHGNSGKGVATKKLKDDGGARTWPRNLTKPWTFRASNDPKDIFARISVGIPGTQMPSFADPQSVKKLSIEERWHVANYVQSLAKSVEVVRPENTVVKADKLTDDLPASPDDPRWAEAEPTTFFLVPQIIAEERLFTPSNDTITVRAVFNDDSLAMLLEWDDRTESLPGDAKAAAIADEELGEDAVAVQWPVTIPEGMKKPYFGMGDATNPVNIWHWTSGPADGSQSVKLIDARGFETFEERSADDLGLSATGV
ncbi:MAG TPA: c-type cytochrome, partial [Afifellaceae bacterium]|nr:c-type cytochrome [Afifellaceae bacterium]